MKYVEATYINEGYKYEQAKTADRARVVAARIRKMLQGEIAEDQAQARYLVERGRQEARGLLT